MAVRSVSFLFACSSMDPGLGKLVPASLAWRVCPEVLSPPCPPPPLPHLVHLASDAGRWPVTVPICPVGRTPGMLLRIRLYWPYLPLTVQGSAGTSLSGSPNIRWVRQPVVWGSPQATTFQMSYPCLVQRRCRNKEQLCGTQGLSPRPGMPWSGGWLPFSFAFSAPLHLASARWLVVQLWLSGVLLPHVFLRP